MYRFDKKWFNPTYFILNDILKDDQVRFVFVYGGKSSSKTVSITQLLTKELVVKGANTIAFRKESSTIPTTLKKSFNLAVDGMYLNPIIDPQDRRYLCTNKAEIVLKGIDSDEKAKGVESYKYLYLDELNHFNQSEFDQMNLSLRGIKGQKIFASWNPVDANCWLKVNLVDTFEWEDSEYKLPCQNSFVKRSKDGSAILIKTTYEDNYWISGSPCGTYGYRDENLIAQYEKLKKTNYNSYKVNVLGEYGKVDFGGEFLKSWRSERHVKKCDYNSSLAIYLSFDENVNPYFPCGIFQIQEDGKTIHLIDYIAAKNPNNTVTWMGREITRKLTNCGHKEAVYICGDATSQKDDVKIEKGHDLFKMLRIELQKFTPILKVSKSNPSVRTSADFFNDILEHNTQGLAFFADDKCRVPIIDFESTKEDKNGKVDKSTVRDPVTKVTYQPFGHFVDLSRYLLVTVFDKEYQAYQRGDNLTKNYFQKPLTNPTLRF